jgi:ATP-dependent Clp protease ATP-binding subunit ClpB
VPAPLRNARLLALDLTALVAGAKYRGEFEERLKGVVDEVRSARDVVLFLDEVHTLVGAGGNEGGMDAANMLKPRSRAGSCAASAPPPTTSTASASPATAPSRAASSP